MSRKLLLSTCGVTLAILTAVLAAPAVSGTDPGMPPAPSSSSIEGVVTSVNWPFNPQGSLGVALALIFGPTAVAAAFFAVQTIRAPWRPALRRPGQLPHAKNANDFPPRIIW